MRNISWLAALLACPAVHGATLGDVYVEKDDCASELLFGDWPVKKRTVVHGAPSVDSKQVGTLEPDTTVSTLACEVHVIPGQARIVGQPYKTTRDLDPKEVVYILDSFEGGRTRVFQNGIFYITKIATSTTQCEGKDDPYRCWAKVLKEPEFSSWIKIKTTGTGGYGWVLIGNGNILPTPRNSH